MHETNPHFKTPTSFRLEFRFEKLGWEGGPTDTQIMQIHKHHTEIQEEGAWAQAIRAGCSSGAA